MANNTNSAVADLVGAFKKTKNLKYGKVSLQRLMENDCDNNCIYVTGIVTRDFLDELEINQSSHPFFSNQWVRIGSMLVFETDSLKRKETIVSEKGVFVNEAERSREAFLRKEFEAKPAGINILYLHGLDKSPTKLVDIKSTIDKNHVNDMMNVLYDHFIKFCIPYYQLANIVNCFWRFSREKYQVLREDGEFEHVIKCLNSYISFVNTTQRCELKWKLSHDKEVKGQSDLSLTDDTEVLKKFTDHSYRVHQSIKIIDYILSHSDSFFNDHYESPYSINIDYGDEELYEYCNFYIASILYYIEKKEQEISSYAFESDQV